MGSILTSWLANFGLIDLKNLLKASAISDLEISILDPTVIASASCSLAVGSDECAELHSCLEFKHFAICAMTLQFVFFGFFGFFCLFVFVFFFRTPLILSCCHLYRFQLWSFELCLNLRYYFFFHNAL